ncbi:MAG: SirB1 family protein [Deltaproteobacteria bacterium]
MAHAARRLFRQLVERPDSDIDLARAALALAADEYPGLDFESYLDRLDGLASAVRASAPSREPLELLGALIDQLGRVERFHGNREQYGDPKNSFLSDVLDRRTGIPLSLSLVYVLVGQRVGLSMAGIAFPGHFLCRCDLDEGFVVLDAFEGGRQLSVDDCQRLLRSIQRDVEFERDMLEPASRRAILFRMLANLKSAFFRSGEGGKAVRAVDQMLVLAPSHPGLLRDRGLLLYDLQRFDEAQRDLERYQELAPSRAAGDLAAQSLLAVSRRKRLMLN